MGIVEASSLPLIPKGRGGGGRGGGENMITIMRACYGLYRDSPNAHSSCRSEEMDPCSGPSTFPKVVSILHSKP